MTTIHHFEFTEELIVKIAEAVKAEGEISRRRLSKRICEWMNWRSANGKLRKVACRKALVELDRRKVIELPEQTREYAFRNRCNRESDLPLIMPLECRLEELGKVELVVIQSAVSKNSRIWNAILDKYHYLGRGPLCGAQIRYLIWSERYGYLGELSFSASAWRLRSRYEHIGWNEEARGRNLQLVVNNSRFLIAPMVKVRDLASYVLSESCKRIGGTGSRDMGIGLYC